jgi:hypothetical protein
VHHRESVWVRKVHNSKSSLVQECDTNIVEGPKNEPKALLEETTKGGGEAHKIKGDIWRERTREREIAPAHSAMMQHRYRCTSREGTKKVSTVLWRHSIFGSTKSQQDVRATTQKFSPPPSACDDDINPTNLALLLTVLMVTYTRLSKAIFLVVCDVGVLHEIVFVG